MTVEQTTRSVQDRPLDVADKLGFFAASGIRVELIVAGSSSRFFDDGYVDEAARGLRARHGR